MKASQISMNKVSILLKAPFGFGKTIAACSFAVAGPVYLAYFDKSQPIELLTFFKKHRPELLENIDYDVFSARNADGYLRKIFDFTRDCKYIAVITDSVTNLTGAAVNWSLAFRDPKGSKKDPKNPSAPMFIPEMDEYKVETGLVTQALDICKSLPCHTIWTAHPLPGIKIEGSGSSMRVSKVTNIVSYGNKVAGIVPGQFSEIYHFLKQTSYDGGVGKTRYLVSTDAVGEDYAKSNLGLTGEFDITNKLFYEVWRDYVKQFQQTQEKEALTNSGNQAPSQSGNQAIK